MPVIVLFSHPTEKLDAVFAESKKIKDIPAYDIRIEDGYMIQAFFDLDTKDLGIQGLVTLLRFEQNHGPSSGIQDLLTEILCAGQQKTA